MEQLFGRSEEELRQKMTANSQIQNMMLSDPSLFDKVNQARLSGNLMTAIQGDQSVQQVVLLLMGISSSDMPEQH